MFRDKLTTVAETQLRGSEGKKLRRRLQDQYPLLSDEQMSKIWPLSSSCTVRKLPNRIFLYSVGRDPLFYTADSSELRPTLYLLQAAPQLMPQLTVYDGVGGKIRGGADLFMPGVVMEEAAAGKSWVHENFGRFGKGEYRAIREASHWAPIAVAQWRVASDELEMQGMRGRGLDIVHTVDDELWKCGSMAIPDSEPESAAAAIVEHARKAHDAEAAVAAASAAEKREIEARENAQFVEEAPKLLKRKQKALRQIRTLREQVESGAVVPDADQQAKLSREQELADEITQIEARLESILNPPPLPEPEAATAAADMDAGPTDGAPADNEGGDRAPASAGAKEGEDEGDGGADALAGEGEAAEGAEEAAEEGPQITMDEQLQVSLLLAIRTTLTPADLPILVSTFTANHLHPASRRVHPTRSLNVKQTRHKKMAAFLDAMQAEGLLKVATEKAGVQRIASVEWQHELVGTVDPSDYPEVAEAEAEIASAAVGQRWQGTMPKRGTKKIEVVQQKKKGNKNVTVVSNLANFGFTLDEGLKKAMARHFSASVSYAEGPDATKGTLIFVQGKYVVQLAKFIETQLGVPSKHIVVNSKGVSARDKAINV